MEGRREGGKERRQEGWREGGGRKVGKKAGKKEGGQETCQSLCLPSTTVVKHAFGGHSGTGLGTRGPGNSSAGKMWRDVPGKLRSPVKEKVVPSGFQESGPERSPVGNRRWEAAGGRVALGWHLGGTERDLKQGPGPEPRAAAGAMEREIGTMSKQSRQACQPC